MPVPHRKVTAAIAHAGAHRQIRGQIIRRQPAPLRHQHALRRAPLQPDQRLPVAVPLHVAQPDALRHRARIKYLMIGLLHDRLGGNYKLPLIGLQMHRVKFCSAE